MTTMPLNEIAPAGQKASEEPRIWPRFLLFPAGAILGYVALVLELGGPAWPAQAGWVLLTSFCWFCVTGSFHESAHQTLGRDRWKNVWWGRVVGTLLAIPYSTFRETHLRHHAHLNTPDDWELWPYASAQSSLLFRRLFVMFDLLGAVATAPIIYGRIYFSRRSPLKPTIRTVIFWEYAALIGFWACVAGAAAALHFLQMVDVRQFKLIWLLPMPLAAGFNTVRKFTEHLGMSSYDPLLGTRSVVGNNPITRLCSYFNFEEFVHGVHHGYPKIAHHKLEETLARLQVERRDETIPVFSSYRAALWDAFPWIVWNPGIGVNAGNLRLPRQQKAAENLTSKAVTPLRKAG